MQDKKQFWNSFLIEKSWRLLQELRKKHDFILIGGWAAFLLANQQKSKDIDIVIDIKELEKLKQQGLIKNDRLKKYELKIEGTDIDIYVEYYSELTIPAEDIKEYTIQTQGYQVVSPEALLILKQGAHKNREYSVKGEKDKIDIISLLFFSDLGFDKYKKILKKYKLESYLDDLKKLVNNFKDYNVLNLTPRQFKIKKQGVLSELRNTVL